jgi:hypothetical protein
MKTIIIFIFLTLGYTTFMGLSLEVKGATYNVPNGTEWTVRMESTSMNGNLTYKVTTSTGTTLRGDAREMYDHGGCNELLDQDLSAHVYSRTQVDGTIAPVSTLKNVTYAGVTLEAWVSTSVPGFDYVAVVNETGMILNISSTSKKLWLTSWKYEACPPGIPGYELPVLLGITTISTIGIIIYIRKKKKY